MRWILLIAVIFLGFFLIFSKNIVTNQRALIPIATSTPTPSSKTFDLVYKDSTYRVSMIGVTAEETVSLFLNLKKKLSLSEAKEQNNCRAVVSGGFYSKSDTPLGLFRTGGKTLNKTIILQLMDFTNDLIFFSSILLV